MPNAIDTLRDWATMELCFDEDCVGCGKSKGYPEERDAALADVEALLQAATEVEDTLRQHAVGVPLIGARHKLRDAVRRVKGDT